MRTKAILLVGAVLCIGSAITWISLTQEFHPENVKPTGITAAPSLAPSSDQITLTSSVQRPTPVTIDVSNARALQPEDFRVFTRQALVQLPKQEDLRASDDKDSHLSMPEPLIDAGQKLGQIAQLVNDNPRLQEEALRFYLDCASIEGLSVSVRALCLASLWKLQKQTGKVMATSNAENFPDNVADIAKQLD